MDAPKSNGLYPNWRNVTGLGDGHAWGTSAQGKPTATDNSQQKKDESAKDASKDISKDATDKPAAPKKQSTLDAGAHTFHPGANTQYVKGDWEDDDFDKYP